MEVLSKRGNDPRKAIEVSRKLLFLSTEVLDRSTTSSAESNSDEESISPHWLPFADNASLRCPTTSHAITSFYGDDEQCPEHSVLRLVWQILYWVKRIVLRLTRSYRADTAVLLLLPLATGLLIGLWLGQRADDRKRREASSQSATTTTSSLEQQQQSWVSTLLRWCPPSLFLWIGQHVVGESCLCWSTTNSLVVREGSQGDDDSMEHSHCNVFHKSARTSNSTGAETQSDKLHQSSLSSSASTSLQAERSDLLHLLQEVERKEHLYAETDRQLYGGVKEFPKTKEQLHSREDSARRDLHSDRGTLCESGIPEEILPRHIAFIMDGNRRYGRKTYGNKVAGHWDGSRKVLDVAKWCIAEKIPYVTVYAFSTENWKRDPAEVASLMEIFAKYSEELRTESLQRNIRVCILSTDPSPIPPHVAAGLQRLQNDTARCTGLCMNVCLSYGSRSEMVHVCRTLVSECIANGRDPATLNEEDVTQRLLTKDCPDPDILVRTSGEMRISNYLLWQLAYAELFFLDKNWPELEKDDFLQVIRSFANGRTRRFGK